MEIVCQEKIIEYIKTHEKVRIVELMHILNINHPQKAQAKLDTLERRGYISKVGKQKYIVIENVKEEIKRLKNVEKEYIILKEKHDKLCDFIYENILGPTQNS